MAEAQNRVEVNMPALRAAMWRIAPERVEAQQTYDQSGNVIEPVPERNVLEEWRQVCATALPPALKFVAPNWEFSETRLLELIEAVSAIAFGFFPNGVPGKSWFDEINTDSPWLKLLLVAGLITWDNFDTARMRPKPLIVVEPAKKDGQTQVEPTMKAETVIE